MSEVSSQHVTDLHAHPPMQAAGSSECTDCATGKLSSADRTSCGDCDAGTYNRLGSEILTLVWLALGLGFGLGLGSGFPSSPHSESTPHFRHLRVERLLVRGLPERVLRADGPGRRVPRVRCRRPHQGRVQGHHMLVVRRRHVQRGPRRQLLSVRCRHRL